MDIPKLTDEQAKALLDSGGTNDLYHAVMASAESVARAASALHDAKMLSASNWSSFVDSCGGHLVAVALMNWIYERDQKRAAEQGEPE